jgi:hypothetical protein
MPQWTSFSDVPARYQLSSALPKRLVSPLPRDTDLPPVSTATQPQIRAALTQRRVQPNPSETTAATAREQDQHTSDDILRYRSHQRSQVVLRCGLVSFLDDVL